MICYMKYEEYLAKNTDLTITINKEMAVFLSYEKTTIRFNSLRSIIGNSVYIDIGIMLLEAIRCKVQKILILLEEQDHLVKENETNAETKEAVLLQVSRYQKLFEGHEQKYKGFIENISKLKAIENGG